MQKKFVKLVAMSSLVLLQAQGLMAQNSQTPPPPAATAGPAAPAPGYILSRTIFRQMMNDPELNRLHLRAQERRLKTAIDYNMQQYFETNPLVQAILPSFSAELNASVQGTTIQNQLSMTEITADSNPKLRYKLVQMMRIQGYSDEEIQNTMFYRALGEVNAYAYTFSPERVGFVLLTGLDDVATSRELMGVFGHESGHIRSGHVKFSTIDTMMQTQVLTALFSKSPLAAGGVQARQLKEYIDGIIADRVSLFVKSAFGGISHNETRARTITKLLQGAGSAPGNYSEEQVAMLLGNYLEQVISNLRTLEVPTRYVKILENAKARLRPGDPISVDVAQVQEALKVWSLAYSREMETSADYFGALIGRPSQIAMMEGKFAGRKILTSPTNEEIRKIVQSVSLQIQKGRDMNPEVYTEIVGGPNSSDHPFSNFRVLRLANFDQSIDRISLENPFLQIVVDLDQAREELVEIDQKIATAKAMKAQFEEKQIADGVVQVKLLLKKLAEQKKQAQRNIAKIEPEITRLLEDPAFSKRHPRSTDLLDFRLAQKQIMETDLAALEQVSPDKVPMLEEAKAYVKNSLQEIVRDPIIKVAVKAMRVASSDPSEKQALEVVLKAFEKSAKPESTREARAALSGLSLSRSRIALDVKSEIKSSNTPALLSCEALLK